MAIQIDLPSEIERSLRSGWAQPLEQVARDLLIAEAYRRGAISLGKVAELLGFPSRFGAERWLTERGIGMNYGPEDIEQDRETTKRLFGKTG
jgi:predicted HTH domain antitoxin